MDKREMLNTMKTLSIVLTAIERDTCLTSREYLIQACQDMIRDQIGLLECEVEEGQP